MTIVLIFAVAALICAALSLWKGQLHLVATILISIALILIAAGANVRL